jgi:uncharacterized membrane protein YdjX (TVP38/TMEM64 family)
MADPPTTGSSPNRLGGRIVVLALFATAIIAFFAFDGPEYLDLDTIKANRDALLAFTDAHYWLALTCAFVIYVTAAALSLPVALVMTLTIGFLFGRWVGTVLVVVAATIGATLVFLAARYLFADAAKRRMGELGARINAGFTENAFSYILFLRIVPFPFVLVNLALAFTDTKLGTYVLATLIGMLPGTFVFVNLGQTLGRIESTRQLLSLETLTAFTLLGTLALLPVLLKRWKPGLGPKP